MIRTTVRVQRTPGFGEDVRRGMRKRMLEAADAGFNTMYDKIPIGATTSLKLSAVQPEWVQGTIFWGVTAPYAPGVEEGQPPHHVPIEDLRVWARRVLGNEQAAGAVQTKIEREGTDPQPFVEPGWEETKRFLNSRGLKSGVMEERQGGP